MSSMPATMDSKYITGEELLEMGNIGPCELVEGRIVPMSPTGGEHSVIEARLVYTLQSFINSKKLGWVVTGEAGIFTCRKPDTVRGADVAFISKKRLPHWPQKGFFEVAPELVIEIMSPTDRWAEIEEKVGEYFAVGVKWVWVVEPNNRAVWLYRSVVEKQKFTENDLLKGEDILAGFTLKISTLFEE